jgi:large subunit ribosomal protein L1
MSILEKVKETKEKSKKRNFNQRYDLIVNLKDLDLKKAENKIDEFFILPKGSGKKVSITLFSDSVKKVEGCKIVRSSEIEELGKKKQAIKKLIKETDFFLSEPKLMPIVGKHLGKFLAPRKLMPKPVVGDVEKRVEELKNSIKIVLDKQPVIHAVVGSEDMNEKDVAENIESVLSFLSKKLPRGKNNIKSVYLKLTMGHPVLIEVEKDGK